MKQDHRRTGTTRRRIEIACLAAGIAMLGSMHASGQSSRPGMGSTVFADSLGTGVTFRVWAPNASSVHVAGTFNGWNTTASPLALEGASGLWSADVAGAAAGAEYKYVINGSLWRTDPRAKILAPSGYNNTVVAPPDSAPAPFTRPAANELVVYEMHVGTFHDPVTNDAFCATFAEAEAKLDHLQALGVNAVELLPIPEFFTARSWGYNPGALLAVERDYGGRQAFAAFATACHARGIALLLDVVHNHWGDPTGDLWQFDGTSAATNTGGIYFYEDAARRSTPWGPRPNFADMQVRNYILDNIRDLLALGCDGFRWDAVYQGVVTTGGSLIPEGVTLMQEAAQIVRSNGALNIAENGASLCPGSFAAQWDYSFFNSLSGYLSGPDAGISVPGLAALLQSVGTSSVVFVENHDQCGQLNAGSARWPVRVLGSGTDTSRATRLARTGTALAFCTRGIPMLFMGQETGATEVWHDDRPLAWSPGTDGSNGLAFHADLIRLRRNADGLTAGLLSTGLVATASNRLLTVWRGAGDAGATVIIANLSASNVSQMAAFPATGWWYAAFSSVDPAYGGNGGGSIAIHATGALAQASIPAYATLMFSRLYDPAGDLDGDGIPNAWEAAHFGHPTNALAAADDDQDGMTTLDEWRADTNPLDGASALRVIGVSRENGGIRLTWTGGSNATQIVETCAALPGPWQPLLTNHPPTLSPASLPVPEPPLDARHFRIRSTR